MGYNRRNLLEKIIKIQDVTLEHTSRGATQEWIFKTLIFPVYHISRATYYSYLSQNAKAELKRLNEAKEKGPPQPSLFD